VTATNLTGSVIPFPGYTPLLVVNLTVSAPVSTMSLAFEMNYKCSVSPKDIVPYVLTPSGWKAVTNSTIDNSSCSIRFSIPNDPVIAIFQLNPSPSVTTTTNQTSNTTTSNSLTLNTKNNKNYVLPWLPLTTTELAAAIVGIILLVILTYMLKVEE
jgi:hypothetical protein